MEKINVIQIKPEDSHGQVVELEVVQEKTIGELVGFAKDKTEIQHILESNKGEDVVYLMIRSKQKENKLNFLYFFENIYGNVYILKLERNDKLEYTTSSMDSEDSKFIIDLFSGFKSSPANKKLREIYTESGEDAVKLDSIVSRAINAIIKDNKLNETEDLPIESFVSHGKELERIIVEDINKNDNEFTVNGDGLNE